MTDNEIREELRYEPITGYFWWRKSGPGRRLNQPAGSHRPVKGKRGPGYIWIKVGGIFYPASHLAVFFMTGSFPENQVDHENHIEDDNRWCNLKKATHLENMHNRRRPLCNTSGVMGVSWNKACTKWHAYISINNQRVHLGFFEDLFEAICTRKSSENANNYHYNHGE